MINILKQGDLLILKYTPDSDISWVIERLYNDEEVNLKKGCFIFSRKQLHSDLNFSVDLDNEPLYDNSDITEVEFILGVLDSDNYYKIEGSKLGIKQDVYIDKELEISTKLFVGVNDTSIFNKISNVVTDNIFIGGSNPDAIHFDDFITLLKKFPNKYELSKYIDARIAAVLSNYYYSASEIKEKFKKYMDKKSSLTGENLSIIFKEVEIIKYESVLKKLQSMLSDSDKYTEKQWQKEIIQIILLLYPKYLYVFEEAPIKDQYLNKNRKIDFLLVDSNGHVDIIEIKKPMDEKMISSGKYRDNHIPHRELSGTVMQVEKYIFHLNKSGPEGEKALTTKYKGMLPLDFNINITNPSGFIIMGRAAGLSKDQLNDFEVVKRKYKSIIDIITYDDLISRLKSIIISWKNRS